MADTFIRLEAGSGLEVQGDAVNRSVTYRLSDDVQQSMFDGTLALQLAQGMAVDFGEIDGRITHLEQSLAQGITANPFNISFSTLTGILVTNGIWNVSAARIEC